MGLFLEDWSGLYWGRLEWAVLGKTGVGCIGEYLSGLYCGELEWALLWKTKVGRIVEDPRPKNIVHSIKTFPSHCLAL